MNAMAAALSPMLSSQSAPQTARSDDARGGEFARCLDHAREGESAEASEAPQRPAAKARSGREGTAPRKAEASTAKEVLPRDPVEADDAIEPETAATDMPRDAAAAPDLAALLPGWSPPAIAVGSATAAEDAPDSADALQATAATANMTTASLATRDTSNHHAASPLEAQPARMAAPHNDNTATASAPSSAPLQAAASEKADTPPNSQAATPPAPTLVAFAAPSTAPTSTVPKAAEPPLPTATVQAPIDAPAFAPSLATQVRWWANDGVQQAQLLLNPAEMGPVAVRIVVLDGREARIDFSADLAATRSAIEAALPVLAAALDDGGLKLTGGGVHDGSAQRQPQWSARSVTHRTANSASTRAGDALGGASAATTAAGRGLVDLVA